MDKYIEITDEDIAEVSKASARAITDIFNLFLKTVKAKLVYPASSKLPQQFKNELYGALTTLLNQDSELAFKVESDSILQGDICVYKASNKSENLARPFFRDGILSFKFKQGLPFDELEAFVDIVSQMTRSAVFDDDAATLLWEAGFEYITYELMDDFLDIDTFEYGTDKLKSGRAPSESDIKGIFENEIELNLTEEDFDLNSEKNRSRAPSAYRDAEDSVARFIQGIMEFSQPEKAEIDRMLVTDLKFDYVKYSIDLLFEILELETDKAGYNETLDLLAKVGADFIRAGDFRSAMMTIERANELGMIFKKVDDHKQEKLLGFNERFAASEKIRVLVDLLNKTRDINYDELTAFLKLLPWQAVDPLVWALGELQHYPARRAVCQALETMAVDHPEILGKGTESPRWYVVRNVISILGRIGDRRTFPFFKRAMKHPDIRVRKEAVISAAKIVSDEAAEFLITALHDDDEKIQILALKEIVERNIIVACENIKGIISRNDFKNRSLEQIREFLAGFAALGGNNAFEHLKSLIKSRQILPSEKNERLKIYAVRALGFLKIADGPKYLASLTQSKNRKIVDMATRTLNRIKKGDKGAW